MKKVKVIINGAAGKMGSAVLRLALEHPGIEVVGLCETTKQLHKLEYVYTTHPEIPFSNNIIVMLSSVDVDVVIDFTNPESALNILGICRDAHKALVTGTTGTPKEDFVIFETCGKGIPIVLAPNMSVGVNLLFRILKNIAKVTGDDYDVEIIEAHHRLKKDAPSGTAKKMAEILAVALGRDIEKDVVYKRHGIIGERTKKEIGIQIIRAGDIAGEHTVLFGGIGERIEITHKATSRDTFAAGALKAAQWIVGKEPGLYDMQDVLGLRG